MTHPAKETDAAHYRYEAAAPFTGRATHLNHPEHGWMRVLDVDTDIEADTVIAALGDPETGAFVTLYKTYYPDTEELILPVDDMVEITHQDDWSDIDAEPVEGVELPSEDGFGSLSVN